MKKYDRIAKRRSATTGHVLVPALFFLCAAVAWPSAIGESDRKSVQSIAFSVEVDGTPRSMQVHRTDDVDLRAKAFCFENNVIEDEGSCGDTVSFHIRSLFADESFKLELYDDASMYYKEMIQMQPDHREARTRLATVYEKMNNLDGAVAIYDALLEEQPNDASALLNVGVIYHRAGDMDTAISYYERIVLLGEHIDRSTLKSAQNNMGLAYLALGVTDRAVQCFMRTAELEKADAKGSDAKNIRSTRKISAQQYLLSDLQASQGNIAGAAESLLASLRTGAGLLGLNDVAKEALLKSVGVLGNQSENGIDIRDSAAPQLVIFCPLKAVYGDGTWGPSSIDTTGIGGSEEAVIFLSRELVRQGFVVRVYCYLRPDDAGRDSHNVVWLPIELFDPDREIADVFVSWRSYRGLLLGRRSSLRYLWLHLKVNGTRLLSPEVIDSLDGVLFVSQRERDRVTESQRIALEDKHGVELIVTTNGLDASYFKDGSLRRASPRFIYASQPNYGLEWLLQMWPQIRAAIPNAELDVYGDYPGEYTTMNGALKDPYEKMREASRVRGLLASLDGVRAHGMVDQRTLTDAFARASFWLYPTSTPETSCITAMRAQAMGAIPITSRFEDSALPQTCGLWDLGPRGIERHTWGHDDTSEARNARARFVAAVVAAVRTNGATLAEHRRKMQDWARQTFSWRRVAKQWALVFSTALSRQRSLVDRVGVDRRRPHFIFIWTTPPSTFTLRCRRAIESALFHHPDAFVTIYSNTLDIDMFSRWRDVFGYDIRIQRYDIEEFVERSPVGSSAEGRDLLRVFFETLRAQPIRYPNVEADLVRLLALLEHGGIYLDLDALVLRPLHGLRNVAAWEGDVPSALTTASDCADRTGTKCTIGNAVLIFDAKNEFVEMCLIEWLSKYARTGGRLNWEYAGEVLTDMFWKRREANPAFGDDETLRLLTRKSFYYYGQFGWGRFFNRQPDERYQYGRLLREAHVAHFWNHVHTYHMPETGSLMFHVLNDFRLQIGPPSHEDDPSSSHALVVSAYE